MRSTPLLPRLRTILRAVFSRHARQILFAILATLSLLVVPALGSAPASAQETPASRSMTVIPPNMVLDANRGDTLERTVAVENTGEVPQNVSVTVRNFKPQAEEGQIAPTDEDSAYSMVKWTSVSPNVDTIKPGERQDFVATIKVPADAEPGSHYVSIVFTPKVSAQANSGFTTTTELTSQILLKVPGVAKEGATVASFSADVASGAKGPVNFVTRITNSGNVHFVPKGEITVTDTFGRKVATIPVNDQNHPVLPGATRRFETKWSTNRLVGRYTAKLHLTYPSNAEGQPDKVLTASTTFQRIPWIEIAAVLAVLAVLILLLVRRSRRRHRPSHARAN